MRQQASYDDSHGWLTAPFINVAKHGDSFDHGNADVGAALTIQEHHINGFGVTSAGSPPSISRCNTHSLCNPTRYKLRYHPITLRLFSLG